jgi:formate-dependent nitrite reductase membrane component NrfD
VAEAPKSIPQHSEWTETLRHRPDPNRVPDLRVPTPARFTPRPLVAADLVPPDPATAESRAGAAPAREAAQWSSGGASSEPSYYDVSILKAPVWKWQIASYFFLGGASAGAFLLARMAERGGGRRYRELTRVGSYIAAACALPCAPLLIADLGDPKRFHHMLRVWKPSTPMNLGTWVMTSYSGAAVAAAVREFLRGPHSPDRAKEVRRIASAPCAALILLQDAAGVPLALLLSAYTGVLLSCTSNPLWVRNPWLAPLFSAGAISTGASAVSLALDCTSSEVDTPSHRALAKVHTAAHVAEAATLAGYLKHAGAKAAPLTRGSMKRHLWFSVGALVAAEGLNWLPFRGATRRWARIVASLLGLASGFSLRWAMIYGGKEAATDPHTARLASQPEGPPGGNGRQVLH